MISIFNKLKFLRLQANASVLNVAAGPLELAKNYATLLSAC